MAQLMKQSEVTDLVVSKIANNSLAVSQSLSGVMTYSTFEMTVRTTLADNPGLMKCTPKSVILSCLKIAQLGLSPNKQLGQAYIVPRGKEAQFQLGAQGVKTLIYRSKRVSGVDYDTVHEGDEFSYVKGSNPSVSHVPNPKINRSWDNLTHAWCCVYLADGPPLITVIDLPRIKQIRGAAAGGAIWAKWPLEMVKKTVLIQARKTAPIDPISLEAMNLSESGEGGGDQKMPLLEAEFEELD